MARLTVDLFSDVLGMGTSLTVLLPERTTGRIGAAGAASGVEPPVLYLLHGLSDDDTAWTRLTSVERYVADLGIAVVMPRVERSFYQDEPHGLRYWSFLSQELPARVESFFRVSARREDTFVAGLSMGGYGALRWGLAQPERFAAVASLSGALDLDDRGTADFAPDVLDRSFGGAFPVGGDADVHVLLRRAVASAAAGGPPLPALYLACGTQDVLVGATRALAAELADAGLDARVDVGPGGHEWAYWDARIRDVLDWLPLRARPVAGAEARP